MQASHFGFRIAEVPARTRYFDDASSIALGPASVYGAQDAVGRGAAAPCTGAASCARASSPADDRHRRARHHAGGRLQPDVAAPRRRLRAVRAAAARGRACSTSGAGSATPTSCSRRARRVGVDIDPEALAGQDARDARRRHAGAAVRRRRASPSVLSVQSIEHVPDPERVARRGRAGARAGRRRGLRDPQPADLRAPRRDHRPLPLRRVRRRTSCAQLCAARFARGARCGGCSAPSATSSSWRSSAAARPAAFDPRRARRAVPRRARQRLYDRCSPARGARGPAGGGDHARRLRAALGSVAEALDLVAVCRV